MEILNRTPGVPAGVLVDPINGLPRFWATVWASCFATQRLKHTTLRSQLRHIGVLYEMSDARYGRGALDNALGNADLETVRAIVMDLYHSLTDEEGQPGATAHWETVQRFFRTLGNQLGAHDPVWLGLVSYMDHFGKIRRPSEGKVLAPRALPDATLCDLLEVAHPEGERNPFIDERVRRRNWLIVNLLLLCGLRRGEMLLLVLDSLKKDVEPTTGEITYWLDVTNTEEDDDRAYQPSIKTLDSHRQVPVSDDLAQLYEHYVAEVRIDAANTFLLTSERGLALSAESVTKMFEVFTAALSETARTRFKTRTKGKRHVSPHDLRHTCATARYNLFMEVEADKELTLQRMRAFFGWSVTSGMPELYANAAIKDDLLRAWNDSFDKRVEKLRRGRL